MDRFLMSVALVLVVPVLCLAQSQYKPQIPNGDFESWTFDGDNLPNNFNSYQTADGKYSGTAYSSKNRQVAKSTDTRPGSKGSYSVSIWSRKVLGVITQGNLTSGRVHASSTSAVAEGNYNYTDRDGSTRGNPYVNPCYMKFTGKPDSAVVWVKFIPKADDVNYPYAKFCAIIHDDFDFADGYAFKSPTSHIVAKAESNFSTTNGKWKRISIPFVYGSSGNPRYILISCATNAHPGAGSTGDYLYIDDIEMIYNGKYDLSIRKENGWSSVCLDFNTSIPSGAKVYIVTDFLAGYLKLKEIPSYMSIPANTAFLVSASLSEIRFEQSDSNLADVSDNMLSGVLQNTSKQEGYEYYVLSGDHTLPDTPVFSLYNGSTLAANKAFLKLPL